MERECTDRHTRREHNNFKLTMETEEKQKSNDILVEAEITIFDKAPFNVWYYLTIGNGERERLLDHYALIDKLKKMRDIGSISLRGIFDPKIDYSAHQQAIQEKLQRLEQKVYDAAPSSNITILN